LNIQNIQNILKDDDFKSVLQMMIDSHMQQIINSNDSDKEIREQSYYKIAAIKELIGSLESIAAGQAIDENRFKIL
jgi:uncharacterized membrane protein YheB (UPF0754 family)